MLLLVLAASATAIATGLGALPVYVLRDTAALRTAQWGVTAGVMGVASIQGLLVPGLRQSSTGSVLGGVAVGVLFLFGARRALGRHEARVGAAVGAPARRAILVFAVLFAHSLPEGLALGAAWADASSALGLFVFLAIAIQNVPEGTATALPLRASGIGPVRAFWAATLTSAPQPVGAAAAYAFVESTRSLAGPTFGFAAGAMLALVLTDVAPAALARGGRAVGGLALLGSAASMALLGAALSVG
jgi:ZIP family zinc transporter